MAAPAPSNPSAPPPSYQETVGGNNPSQSHPKGGPAPPYPPQPGPVPPIYVAQPLAFYDRPVQMACPSCGQLIVTRLARSAGALTWLSSGVICLFGCWLGCCLVPFCVDALMDVEHFCPNCQALLGCYRRL